MSAIDDLKKSISEMPDDELMDLIIGVRASRRIRKEKPTKKKKSSVIDMTKLVKNISPEVAKALLKQLQKGKK